MREIEPIEIERVSRRGYVYYIGALVATSMNWRCVFSRAQIRREVICARLREEKKLRRIEPAQKKRKKQTNTLFRDGTEPTPGENAPEKIRNTKNKK